MLFGNNDLKGLGKPQSTEFVANFELHIVSKVTTCKISLTLKFTYKWLGLQNYRKPWKLWIWNWDIIVHFYKCTPIV
jgi:hypothetical protein